MNESVLLFSILTILLYGVGTVGYLIYIIRPNTSIQRVASLFLLGGFVSHTLELLLVILHIHYAPVTTLQQTLSFFVWAIVGSYLAFQLKFNIRILGTFVSPLAVVFIVSFGRRVRKNKRNSFRHLFQAGHIEKGK